MDENKEIHVVMFVGFPGCGKTSIISKILEYYHSLEYKEDYKIHVIEQDDYYKNEKCDSKGYLSAIDKCIRNIIKNNKNKNITNKNIILLGKNHHTRNSREEVLSILRSYSVKYTIVNLIPEFFVISRDRRREDDDERSKYEQYISSLLDRIENRTTESHLSIKRARNVLRHGFMKTYEEPDEPFTRLADDDSVEVKANIIIKLI